MALNLKNINFILSLNCQFANFDIIDNNVLLKILIFIFSSFIILHSTMRGRNNRVTGKQKKIGKKERRGKNYDRDDD